MFSNSHIHMLTVPPINAFFGQKFCSFTGKSHYAQRINLKPTFFATYKLDGYVDEHIHVYI